VVSYACAVAVIPTRAFPEAKGRLIRITASILGIPIKGCRVAGCIPTKGCLGHLSAHFRR
jgi:hypothetical protein